MKKESKLRQNIKKAIKDFTKQYGHPPITKPQVYGSFWNNLAWKLDRNDIVTQFTEVSSGECDFYVMATYWSKKLEYSIVLSWDCENDFENEKELIDYIEKKEKEGKAIEKSILVKNQ